MADRTEKEVNEERRDVIGNDAEFVEESPAKGTWREHLQDHTCVICSRRLGEDQLTCSNCGMDYSAEGRPPWKQ